MKTHHSSYVRAARVAILVVLAVSLVVALGGCSLVETATDSAYKGTAESGVRA